MAPGKLYFVKQVEKKILLGLFVVISRAAASGTPVLFSHSHFHNNIYGKTKKSQIPSRGLFPCTVAYNPVPGVKRSAI